MKFLLLQVVNQVLITLSISPIIVYFSESLGSCHFYAVQSFSCDQWER